MAERIQLRRNRDAAYKETPVNSDPVPKWPASAPRATDLLAYYAGRGLWLSAASWAFVPCLPGSSGFDVYMTHTIEMIDCHNQYVLLSELMEIDPQRADDLAKRIWRAADAGDSYGECLWLWAGEHGLDVELIQADGTQHGEMAAARYRSSDDRA